MHFSEVDNSSLEEFGDALESYFYYPLIYVNKMNNKK